MPKLRIVVVETDGIEPAAIAEAIRLYAGGEARTADVLPPPISAPLLAPAPAAAVAASQAPAHVARPKAPKARGGKARGSSPASPVAAAAPPEDSGCVAACVQALAKGPLSSPEVIKRAGYSDGAVYVALKALRTSGRVEMIDDDGVRKNSLVS